MAGRYELYRDARGERRFRLKAGNGETILASEGYKTRAGALNGVEAVRKSADLLARFEKKSSANGKLYFVLKASNGEIVATSEMYDSEAARDNGIRSALHVAPLAKVEDLTAKEA